jgi:NADP-dependent 3-hydroxy acid dehydrogenase YdfG
MTLEATPGASIRSCVIVVTGASGGLGAAIAINFKSALHAIQAVLPHFQERARGHIINVSSILGRLPVAADVASYGAAKAALDF